jgi:type III protein arginine methyltransferase
MYGGLDKEGGGIVASHNIEESSIDFLDICDNASAEEMLVCSEVRDGEARTLYASAYLNILDGSVCWREEYNEDEVLRRTIAMSQMSSMLRDSDRNNAFEKAIQSTIAEFIHGTGRAPTVLDIGTGTGLLAMMCIRHGAQFVVGCEMFSAMAQVATAVIAANSMSDQILIIPAKSNDVDSLPFQPDIIISELLDSSLLGEGVLPAHADAILRLIDRDPVLPEISQRVIPHQATVFGTLIQSNDVASLFTVDVACMGGCSPSRSGVTEQCGWSKVIPVRWLPLQERGAKLLGAPQPILSTDFCRWQSEDKDGDDEERRGKQHRCRIVATESGVINGLLLWWRADLSPVHASECTYSTEPGSQKWQDHWTQAVYPLHAMSCNAGDSISVLTCHDGINIWCRVEPLIGEQSGEVGTKRPREIESAPPSPPLCTCGWHLLCGADRIAALNDRHVLDKWATGLAEVVRDIISRTHSHPNRRAVILDVSDGSVLSFLVTAELRKLSSPVPAPLDGDGDGVVVVSVERKAFSCLFHRQLVAANEDTLLGSVVILDEDEWRERWPEELGCPQIDTEGEGEVREPYVAAIVSECFYYQLHTRPVMATLSFLYALNFIRQRTVHQFPRPLVSPRRARVMTAAFELIDLTASHGIVGR